MRVLVAIAGLTLSAGVAPAQEVLLRLAPPIGQVSSYQTDMNMRVQLEGMGEFTMRLGMGMIQTVTAIEGDVRLLALHFDSVTMESEGFPAAGMGNAMEDLRMTMRMDTRGRVLSMELEDGPAGLPMPGMDAFGQGVAQVYLPEYPVVPGATWADTATVDMSAGGIGGAMSKNLVYRLERTDRIDGERVAILSMSGTFTQEMGAGGGGGFSMDMSGSMRGTITLSLDQGRLTDYEMEMTGSMDSPMSPTAASVSMTMQLNLRG